MSMLEWLEKDKDMILRKLKNSENMEKAELVVSEEFDRLLLQYNENCDEALRRDTAASLIQTAKLSTGLINSVGETRIFEEAGALTQVGTKTMKQKICLGAAGVSGALSVLFGIFSTGRDGGLVLSNILLAVLFMVIDLAAAIYYGKDSAGGIAKSSRGKSSYRTENKVDPERIYACIHNTLYAVDQNLEQLALPDFSMEEDDSKTGGLPVDELELFSDLLEALCCEDGDYALDKLENVKYYLHQQGIEVVTYNGSNKELFDFMPSMKQGTFRPALVKDGKVLRRGLAAGGM